MRIIEITHTEKNWRNESSLIKHMSTRTLLWRWNPQAEYIYIYTRIYNCNKNVISEINRPPSTLLLLSRHINFPWKTLWKTSP
jgi:hypothetical protein